MANSMSTTPIGGYALPRLERSLEPQRTSAGDWIGITGPIHAHLAFAVGSLEHEHDAGLAVERRDGLMI